MKALFSVNDAKNVNFVGTIVENPVIFMDYLSFILLVYFWNYSA
jgi:hypothetical protein